MARNKTMFLYNDSKPFREQEWAVYSQDIINQTYKVGAVRKSFMLTLSGNVVIQFGVDNVVYLRATYTYATDSWTSHTDTPNEISFSALQSAVTVTSSYVPEDAHPSAP